MKSRWTYSQGRDAVLTLYRAFRRRVIEVQNGATHSIRLAIDKYPEIWEAVRERLQRVRQARVDALAKWIEIARDVGQGHRLEWVTAHSPFEMGAEGDELREAMIDQACEHIARRVEEDARLWRELREAAPDIAQRYWLAKTELADFRSVWDCPENAGAAWFCALLPDSTALMSDVEAWPHVESTERQSTAPATPATPTPEPAAKSTDPHNEAKALGLIAECPDMSIAEIAETIGVSRTTPYKWPRFMTAFRLAKEERMGEPKRGYKDPETGEVVSW